MPANSSRYPGANIGNAFSPAILEAVIIGSDNTTATPGQVIDMKTRAGTYISMENIASIFNITPLEFKMFYEFSIQHQAQLVKLISVLFRQQIAYLYWPIALPINTNIHNDIPVIWAWRAWECIKNNIMTHRQEPRSPSKSLQAWCWKCFTPTSSTCSKCKQTCDKLYMRSIPICTACRQCKACDQEEDTDDQKNIETLAIWLAGASIDSKSESNINNRYSFHMKKAADWFRSTIEEM